MRISDWSSDVCSSDLLALVLEKHIDLACASEPRVPEDRPSILVDETHQLPPSRIALDTADAIFGALGNTKSGIVARELRSEEHTSEHQTLMRNSYAVFCLKKKKKHIVIYKTPK